MRGFMKAAIPAGIAALAMWAGPAFAQNTTGAATAGSARTGQTTTNFGTTSTTNTGMNSGTGAYGANGYGYGVGSFGTTGYGYGIQAAPNGYSNSLNTNTGPVGYGYGVGNFGTAGYMVGNNSQGVTGLSYGLSTTTASPTGYGYGVGSFGSTGYGYGMGNYNNPGLGNRNPYTVGAYTGTFAANGPAAGNTVVNPAVGITPNAARLNALYNPATMSMNGIYATQYGPYGLATSPTGSLMTTPSGSLGPTNMGGATTTAPNGVTFVR